MSIFSVFAIFGGVAMFLYGMNIMGAGLETLGGGRFERILEKLTSNPIKGVLLGAAITALIQSSSGTTVMVVGFVNSGIMKLTQAIGIIMGANIGTTITSWILSLSGIEGDSFIINILKPANFSPIFAFVGIILIMFTKSDKKHNIGNILIGFAVLMFGMETVSNAVKPLADVPEFTSILTMFQNPVLGVIAGAVLTGIIQSSAASVGILQALSATGQITFGAAIPIIMGQNIGTCVTALISCIGANKAAKQAAMVHLYFNIIGTILFLILFYAANAILHFTFLDDAVNGFNVAVVHTTFNILATAVLLPFYKQLGKLAVFTIKDTEKTKTKDTDLLDERFLQTPSYAVEQCSSLTTNMAYIAQESVEAAADCVIGKYSKQKDELVVENEDKTDKYEDKIGSYLVKLSAKSLSMADSQRVSLLLHVIGEIERIADYAVGLLRVAREIEQKNMKFSEKGRKEIEIMTKAVFDIVTVTVEVFANNDIKGVTRVEALEEVIDTMKTELKNRHIKRLQNKSCTVEAGFVFNDYVSYLEKISDHCLNIAVSMIQMDESQYDIHRYMSDVKAKDDEYRNYYVSYSKKYALPFKVTQ